MQFKGTKNYIATDDLSMAVNASVALERPLLIKGEPGTGKTLLAIEVADALGLELIEWHIKSTTKATQGLYEYVDSASVCNTSVMVCIRHIDAPYRDSTCQGHHIVHNGHLLMFDQYLVRQPSPIDNKLRAVHTLVP